MYDREWNYSTRSVVRLLVNAGTRQLTSSSECSNHARHDMAAQNVYKSRRLQRPTAPEWNGLPHACRMTGARKHTAQVPSIPCVVLVGNVVSPPSIRKSTIIGWTPRQLGGRKVEFQFNNRLKDARSICSRLQSGRLYWSQLKSSATYRQRCPYAL